jgi:hypothetical protein
LRLALSDRDIGFIVTAGDPFVIDPAAAVQLRPRAYAGRVRIRHFGTFDLRTAPLRVSAFSQLAEMPTTVQWLLPTA